jgi:hypothetical protein
MNTFQLEACLKKAGRCVVVPIDRLKYLTCDNKPLGVVVNTDRSDSAGEHWIAVYFTGDGGGEYYDSFGLPPLRKTLIDFMNRNCPDGWSYNNVTKQEFEETNCGNHCVKFLAAKFKGMNFCDFLVRK